MSSNPPPPPARALADINNPAYGGFNLANLRVAYAVETDVNSWTATTTMYHTLSRLSIFTFPPIVPPRTLQGGPTTGPVGVSPPGDFSATGNATLDTTRYVLYGPSSQATSCPWTTTSTAPNSGNPAPCTTNFNQPGVVGRGAGLVAYYGQYMFGVRGGLGVACARHAAARLAPHAPRRTPPAAPRLWILTTPPRTRRSI